MGFSLQATGAGEAGSSRAPVHPEGGHWASLGVTDKVRGSSAPAQHLPRGLPSPLGNGVRSPAWLPHSRSHLAKTTVPSAVLVGTKRICFARWNYVQQQGHQMTPPL